MASKTDYQVASLAAGWTLGFGFLTVWEAIKQTRRNRNPARSAYIYMVWGEIVANLAITIIVWLLLEGILKPEYVNSHLSFFQMLVLTACPSHSVPSLFFILFCWVFEIQLLMQIIINRISIIADSRRTIRFLKWGTALFMTLINIAVFCIFIPAHMVPPVSQT